MWIGGASEAAAHGLDGPPHAQNALLANGKLLAAPTNFGLVSRVGDGWSWTPEELVRGVIATSSVVDGRPALGTTDGLYMTADGGCTWTGPAELVGTSVLTIEVEDDLVWVGTEAATRPSGLFVSQDGGASFAPGELFGPGIRVGGIKRGADVTWVTVFDANIVEWQVWFDAGAGFERVEDAGEMDRVRLFEAEQDSALFAFEFEDAWRLENLKVDGSREVWRIDAEPVDATLRGRDRPVFVTSRAELRDPTDSIATEVYCVSDDLTCHSVDGSDALVAQGGTALVTWQKIAPADCEDPQAAEEVALYWPTAQAAGFGPTPQTEDLPSSGCCSQARSKPYNTLIWLLLWVLLMQRLRAAKMSGRQAQERA